MVILSGKQESLSAIIARKKTPANNRLFRIIIEVLDIIVSANIISVTLNKRTLCPPKH